MLHVLVFRRIEYTEEDALTVKRAVLTLIYGIQYNLKNNLSQLFLKTS